MRRILAVLLASVLLCSVTGCAVKADKSGDIINAEGTVLSRAEKKPLVEGGEFPSADDAGAIALPAVDGNADAIAETPLAQGSKDFIVEALPEEKSKTTAKTTLPVPSEVRAVWFSFLDLTPMIQGKSQSSFKANIGKAFDNCKDMGLNTVIVQVRPFADALYNSAYFPYSYIVSASKTEGENPGYDPLAVMVAEAHSRGLRIEAWLNPYRVRNPGAKEQISSDSPAYKWQNENSDYVLTHKGGVYFNPARKDVQDLIVNGVKEIVKNYAVDGIHFDDYFYPSPDNSFDSEAYGEYKDGGGKQSLGDWRRANVDTLVKRVYKEIKAIRSSCLFGISPQGNHSNNYSQQYIDVAKWGSTPGYVDYICPQIYWSYENTAAPYAQMLKSWEDMITSPKVQLYIGLATYKVGGEFDFKNCTDMMERQVEDAREMDHYKGFALYRYDSLFNPASRVASQISDEIQNLEGILR